LCFPTQPGAADISSAQIVINSSFIETNSCYLYLYANGANVIYLANNAGALQSSLPVGTAGTLRTANAP
jgi:hypothetical protein